MSACMWMLLGRSVVDPEFRDRFFKDPLAACKLYGGTKAESNALKALDHNDLQVLGKQLTNIRAALDKDAVNTLSTDPNVQLIFGRALMEPSFAHQLEQNADAAVGAYLHKGVPAAEHALAVFKSPAFKKLKGFAAHREAMRTVGAKFTQHAVR